MGSCVRFLRSHSRSICFLKIEIPYTRLKFLLDNRPIYGAEIQRTSALISELSLRYRAPISRIFISYSDRLNLESLLLRNIASMQSHHEGHHNAIA
jgi:hypothetical protein